MPDPQTINGVQCNELARRVFYRALEAAEKEIPKSDFNAPKVAALAALAEACGNDFEASDEE